MYERYTTVTRPLHDRYTTVTRPLRDRYTTVFCPDPVRFTPWRLMLRPSTRCQRAATPFSLRHTVAHVRRHMRELDRHGILRPVVRDLELVPRLCRIPTHWVASLLHRLEDVLYEVATDVETLRAGENRSRVRSCRSSSGAVLFGSCLTCTEVQSNCPPLQTSTPQP